MEKSLSSVFVYHIILWIFIVKFLPMNSYTEILFYFFPGVKLISNIFCSKLPFPYISTMKLLSTISPLNPLFHRNINFIEKPRSNAFLYKNTFLLYSYIKIFYLMIYNNKNPFLYSLTLI